MAAWIGWTEPPSAVPIAAIDDTNLKTNIFQSFSVTSLSIHSGMIMR